MKQHCSSEKTILTLGTHLFQCDVMLHLQSHCLLLHKNYVLQSCPSWCAKVWPAFFVCYRNCWIPTSIFFLFFFVFFLRQPVYVYSKDIDVHLQCCWKHMVPLYSTAPRSSRLLSWWSEGVSHGLPLTIYPWTANTDKRFSVTVWKRVLHWWWITFN